MYIYTCIYIYIYIYACIYTYVLVYSVTLSHKAAQQYNFPTADHYNNCYITGEAYRNRSNNDNNSNNSNSSKHK